MRPPKTISQTTTIADSKHYPLYLFLAHLPLLLYMQKSKINSRGLELNGPAELIGYFHADLILYIVIVLTCTYITHLRRLAAPLFLAAYYLNVADWSSWSTQSKAFFFSDLNRAMQLLIHYPEFWQNLSIGFKLKLTVLLVFPVVFITLAHTRILLRPITPILKPAKVVTLGIAAAALSMTPFLLSASYLYQNSLAFMLSEQFYERNLHSQKADLDSIYRAFGQHTETPTPATEIDTHRQPNIIIYVIETAPYNFYPDLREIVEHANIEWLSNHGIVFESHFSTYPGSDRSTFSIFSGHYPPTEEDNEWKNSMRYGESLPKTLAKHGYQSYLFSTAPLTFNNDNHMYENLGFDIILEADGVKDLRTKTQNGYVWDRTKLYAADQSLTESAIATINEHTNTEHQTPFFIAILPQSSHAPFHCPPVQPNAHHDCSSEKEKIRANAKWQAELIKSIVSALQEASILDNTVLIITGDHGLRSPHETELFHNPHALQQSTFHVPLMLASSKINKPGMRMSHKTSHIDIAPTLIDLAGLPRNKHDFHGVSLLEKTDRTLFFISKGYSASNGFWKDDHFFMENRSNNTYMKSSTFTFNRNASDIDDRSERKRIKKELMKFEVFLRETYRHAP